MRKSFSKTTGIISAARAKKALKNYIGSLKYDQIFDPKDLDSDLAKENNPWKSFKSETNKTPTLLR